MTLPFLIIGNPGNRRVQLFQEALTALGHAPGRVVAWLDLINDPSILEAIPDQQLLVRIDSAGECFEVERALLRRGFEAALEAGVTTIDPLRLDALREDRGLILPQRQHHLGFLAVLGQLAALFERRPRWIVLNPPADIATLFDKRETSRLYASRGVPVPPPLEGISELDALRERLRERRVPSCFIKVSCASSASCLAIYQQQTNSLLTTIEQTPSGWYNSLRVRRVNDPKRVEEIVSFLIREGAQIEETVPKARLERAFFDLRVLVIAATPAFFVVRQSRHPITNLHLGGWRGNPKQLLEAVPPESWEAAMSSCGSVFAAHGCLHLGIDLMFEPGLRRHRIIEANAFGDLLPNLARDGLSVYQWEIRETQGHRFGPSGAHR